MMKRVLRKAFHKQKEDNNQCTKPELPNQFTEEEELIIFKLLENKLNIPEFLETVRMMGKYGYIKDSIPEVYRILANIEFVRELIYDLVSYDSLGKPHIVNKKKSLFPSLQYINKTFLNLKLEQWPQHLEDRLRYIQLFYYLHYFFDPNFEEMKRGSHYIVQFRPHRFSFRMEDLWNSDLFELIWLRAFLARLQALMLFSAKQEPSFRDTFRRFEKFKHGRIPIKVFHRARILYMVFRSLYYNPTFSKEWWKYLKAAHKWFQIIRWKLSIIINPSRKYCDCPISKFEKMAINPYWEYLFATYYSLLFHHSPLLDTFCSSLYEKILKERFSGMDNGIHDERYRCIFQNDDEFQYYSKNSLGAIIIHNMLGLLLWGSSNRYNKKGIVKQEREVKLFYGALQEKYRRNVYYFDVSPPHMYEPKKILQSKTITEKLVFAQVTSDKVFSPLLSIYAPGWRPTLSEKEKFEEMFKRNPNLFNTVNMCDIILMHMLVLNPYAFSQKDEFMRFKDFIGDYFKALCYISNFRIEVSTTINSKEKELPTKTIKD